MRHVPCYGPSSRTDRVVSCGLRAAVRSFVTQSRLLPLALLVSLVGAGILPAQEQVGESADSASRTESPETTVDFATHVAPVLNKYCVSCHNADVADGGLSLETYEGILAGGERGPALLAGQSESSRMVRFITGAAEPRMPPDEMEGPNEDELNRLIAWIDAGAAGPTGEMPSFRRLLVPELPAADGTPAITAMAWTPDQQQIAVARFQQVALLDASSGDPVRSFGELPGKVNSLRFSGDGRWLIAASGVTGLYGVAQAWDVATGEVVFRIEGHRDSLYAATVSPDRAWLATAGYDKAVMLWKLPSGERVHRLTGHNQPVYDLDFSPDSSVLISASGDETLKVWHVQRGERLDTLSQPLAEQYVSRFTPDGRWIVGAGADNRIRVWKFVSRDEPRINPLQIARFAHEGPINALDFSEDGRWMVTVAEDRSLKAWDTQTWTEAQLFSTQPDIVSSLAIAPAADRLFVGRMDGSLESYPLAPESLQAEVQEVTLATPAPLELERVETQAAEQEPNDSVEQAQPIGLPTRITGSIASQAQASTDSDYFRFEAQAGQTWIMEVLAQRNGSPLDSYMEVLDERGEPVMRVLLQAVRDSYFTFRGKDSNTSDDFRVHNWEEMELNEYLYANGEVVKLWLYPRGPDSGFQVYPGKGNRHTFFDTTPMAHALQEPCYIVKPFPPETMLIPNGLPTFPIYFSNDDDGKRRYGKDSWLQFTAPRDGVYHVRVSDARGFADPKFAYELVIRPAQPDFKVSVSGLNSQIAPGGAREFTVSAERMDGFQGPIRVEVDQLPPGFRSSSPIIVQEGQYEATGVIWAEPDATPPAAETPELRVRASAEIHGQKVMHPVNSLGKVQLLEGSPLRVRLAALSEDESQGATSADPLAEATATGENSSVASDSAASTVPQVGEDGILELVIRPGETLAAKVSVERNGHQGIVNFGNADSGRNLPHGVYVDNIGLNGLMIIEGQSERTFFITAADWVPPQERLFHLRATLQGGQCAIPARLIVLPRE